MEYSAYAITIRPVNGITDDQIAAVVKMVRGRCDYYVVITEKTGDCRHLHAGLFLKKPTQRKKLNEAIRNLAAFKDLTTNERYVLSNGTKIMYNMDFINEYLQKGDDTELIALCPIEEEHADKYFPSKEEQTRVQRDARIAKAKNRQMALLEELWYEHTPPGIECTFDRARNFLADMAFNKRLIYGFRHPKDISPTAKLFQLYVNKVSNITLLDI